jgi:hypothetical protein
MYSANEIAICLRIAQIHLGPQIRADGVKELLLANVLATEHWSRACNRRNESWQTPVDELLNFIPILGWAVKGVLAAPLPLAWAGHS